MSTRTELEFIFSGADDAAKARRIAETMIYVYFRNHDHWLLFDDIKPQNAGGWIHYPERYVRFEEIGDLTLLWSQYRMEYDSIRRSMSHTPDLQDARKAVRQIRQEGNRLKFGDCTRYACNAEGCHQIENLYFEDCTEETEDSTPENRSYVHDINDVRIESVPVVKYNIAFDNDLMGYLTTTFMNQYEHIDTTIKNRLRNETIIDAKFYNTYGRSNNYYAAGDIVNDSVLLLDTLNISIFFDMWFVQGTDLENAINEVKMYIKNRIESINNEGSNVLHISNLMREIETNYAYVDHIRFLKINNYDTNVQSLVLVFPTLDDMDKITRRKYVPELITCDLDDIHINGSYNI